MIMERIASARRQLYVAKDMEELCKMLDTLSKEASEPKFKPELTELMYTLKTQRLRHRKDALAFCCAGGVLSLIRLLSVAEDYRDLVLLLATLANVCCLDCSARNQVMNHGLERLVKTLQESSSSDVINTTARCLANLGLDEVNISTLQQHGVMQHIVRQLSRDNCSAACNKCKQSLLRCARILSSNPDCRDELKSLEGVSLIVECLKSHDEDVGLSALQPLEVLAQDSDPDALRPLYEAQAMQYVIRFCNHSKASVRKSAMILLLNCTKSSDGRVVLSSAGGVETLVAAIESTSKDSEMFQDVVCGACVCCREVVSRQRLRDCGGLHKMIKMLLVEEHSGLYHNIMAALVCYYFDENTLKVMVRQMGLLGALKHHLELNTRAALQAGKRVNHQPVEDTAKGEEKDEGELMDSEETTVVLSYHSEVESEGSDIADVRSVSCSSSPTSVYSGASSEPPPSSLTQSSSQPYSATPSDVTETQPAVMSTHSLCIQEESQSCLEPGVSGSQSPTPPVSTKRPRLQVDLDLSSPMPANFLDSLLSSPNPYQKESKAPESTFISEQTPPLISQIILMLSRISHLRDFLTYLSSPEMLPAILGYFAIVKPPDHHIFKVLTRVFMNPNCFQDCISCLVPSKLYELLRLADAADSDELVISPLASVSLPSQAGCTFMSLCHSLLGRLSNVAESPYGQGVLAHSLLRGDDTEKQASCLSLPLLCRSPRLCQRMMLGYGGFHCLCRLSREDADDDLQAMALDSLLQLAHTMIRPSSRKRRHSYSTSDDLTDVASPSKVARLNFSFSHQEPLQFPSLPLPDIPLLIAQAISSSKTTNCRYRDSDHCPFDMVITVKNEGCDSLSIQVHRSTLVNISDVFAVMLGGQYMESSCSEVVLHKIPPLAFLSVIHHTYGCGWQCPRVLVRVREVEWLTVCDSDVERDTFSQERLNLSWTSDILISQVVDKCVGETEKKLARHCLQVLSCAGMFLLPELVMLCEHEAVSYLVPDNVPTMFTFAELHRCMCLAESCMRSVVNLQHSQERTEILRDIIKSPQGETALNIIKVFLEQSTDL